MSNFSDEQLRQLATTGSADGITLNSLTVGNLAKELFLSRQQLLPADERTAKRHACLTAAGGGTMDTMPPYTADEQRVCEYLLQMTQNQIGCGDDPIGFLIASHAFSRAEASSGYAAGRRAVLVEAMYAAGRCEGYGLHGSLEPNEHNRKVWSLAHACGVMAATRAIKALTAEHRTESE